MHDAEVVGGLQHVAQLESHAQHADLLQTSLSLQHVVQIRAPRQLHRDVGTRPVHPPVEDAHDTGMGELRRSLRLAVKPRLRRFILREGTVHDLERQLCGIGIRPGVVGPVDGCHRASTDLLDDTVALRNHTADQGIFGQRAAIVA